MKQFFEILGMVLLVAFLVFTLNPHTLGQNIGAFVQGYHDGLTYKEPSK